MKYEYPKALVEREFGNSEKNLANLFATAKLLKVGVSDLLLGNVGGAKFDALQERDFVDPAAHSRAQTKRAARNKDFVEADSFGQEYFDFLNELNDAIRERALKIYFSVGFARVKEVALQEGYDGKEIIKLSIAADATGLLQLLNADDYLIDDLADWVSLAVKRKRRAAADALFTYLGRDNRLYDKNSEPWLTLNFTDSAGSSYSEPAFIMEYSQGVFLLASPSRGSSRISLNEALLEDKRLYVEWRSTRPANVRFVGGRIVSKEYLDSLEA
jgi:hypothetical protein